MATKSAKLLEMDDIGFDEIDGEWLAIKFGNEKFVMDIDTLIDLSFRCAAFLSFLENKKDDIVEDAETQCSCASTKYSVH